MIKCACETIQPLLVEDILQKHPEVEKVCVVGVPDQRLYQKICACIILKAGNHGSQEEREASFDNWCKDKFYETSQGMVLKPHYFVFLEDFPLTRTGKLSRGLVKEIAMKELGI